MTLTNRVQQTVDRYFQPADRKIAAVLLLRKLREVNEGRVRRAVCKLAKGDLNALREYIRAANGDWRDVLMWSGC